MLKINKRAFLLHALLLVSLIIHGQNFEPQKGSLSKVNKMFHEDYNKLVQFKIATFGDSIHPVIVFTGDSLLFKYQNKRTAARVVPAEYHLLKAVSHLPLAIFTMVSTWKEGKIADSNVVKLDQYNSLIEAAEIELKACNFTPLLLNKQEEITSHSKEYIALLKKEKKYEIKDRDIFAKSVQKYLMEDVDEAAKLEINAIHQQVQYWKKQIGEEAFNKMYVVIGSSHQARYRELSVQYFDKVLHERSGASALTENRLVFAESVFNEAGCLSMLARHIIDQEIGLNFFGDRYRMQRDLLSDAASKYIHLLFSETPSGKDKKKK